MVSRRVHVNLRFPNLKKACILIGRDSATSRTLNSDQAKNRTLRSAWTRGTLASHTAHKSRGEGRGKGSTGPTSSYVGQNRHWGALPQQPQRHETLHHPHWIVDLVVSHPSWRAFFEEDYFCGPTQAVPPAILGAHMWVKCRLRDPPKRGGNPSGYEPHAISHPHSKKCHMACPCSRFWKQTSLDDFCVPLCTCGTKSWYSHEHRHLDVWMRKQAVLSQSRQSFSRPGIAGQLL